VRSREEVGRAVSLVGSTLGPASVLVNNSGVARPTRIDGITDEEYDLVVDVSLRGSFLCSQAVLPHMRQLGGGRMVNVASVAAERGGGLFGGPHYAAAKAGVLGLTRALARDLAPENIRVNAVAPGFIETGIFGDELTEDRRAAIVEAVPLGRPGSPRDVAQCCLFLASRMSDYVTGEVLDVNGGLHID
jgi:NAD(P)-dependent dehydrogenase (short-subunit alcohol dehydrogenase family)